MTDGAQTLLFSPLQLRDVALKNRVVVAPMHQYSADRGAATDWHLMNIGRFAAGGAGLVFIESTKVERRGCGTVGDLGLWDDSLMPPIRRLAAFIRAQGAVPALQLGHSGRKARLTRPWEGGRPLERSEVPDWDEWELVAPSARPGGKGEPVPRALERAEIADVVGNWARAAARADAAGVEVLEIHGAHGYLIHQFLSPEANGRSDEYGGSLGNRMRFAIEVVEAVRAAWPARKPLFLRLSVEDGAGWGVQDSIALAREVKPRGVDVIDCSSGGMRGAPVVGRSVTGQLGYGYQVPLAEGVRAGADIMTMAVGLIVHAEQAEAILRDGHADLIALAREILYNPNWPMDAAHKLGAAAPFALVPPQGEYWLAKRAQAARDVVPSTYAAPR